MRKSIAKFLLVTALVDLARRTQQGMARRRAFSLPQAQARQTVPGIARRPPGVPPGVALAAELRGKTHR